MISTEMRLAEEELTFAVRGKDCEARGLVEINGDAVELEAVVVEVLDHLDPPILCIRKEEKSKLHFAYIVGIAAPSPSHYHLTFATGLV